MTGPELAQLVDDWHVAVDPSLRESGQMELEDLWRQLCEVDVTECYAAFVWLLRESAGGRQAWRELPTLRDLCRRARLVHQMGLSTERAK